MFKTILIVILILIIFFLVVIVIDENRYIIREYEIHSNKLNKEVTLCLVSDLHNKEYGKHNKKLLDTIDQIHPDLICSAGDMITARPGKSIEKGKRFMISLAKKYPVYYGIGNHEYRMKKYTEDYGSQYEEMKQEIEDCGIPMLENESVDVNEYQIVIDGLMLNRKYYKRFHTPEVTKEYLDTTLEFSEPDKFHILLAHNPDFFESYASWGADLVLSGHVHGGIMNLPILGGVISPKLSLFPKYDGGEFHMKDSTMILSRGLGTHTLPIRIFNPGELVVIRLFPCQS